MTSSCLPRLFLFQLCLFDCLFLFFLPVDPLSRSSTNYKLLLSLSRRLPYMSLFLPPPLRYVPTVLVLFMLLHRLISLCLNTLNTSTGTRLTPCKT
ncbi:uncharacterized protein BJ171DRAFT_127146 [Polychytrium aggregatum]|uniref:uncharacterized protein n=1 Tax=Polychytrium aggregatum TaxID=110093 RepID=UPI0022FE6987|nr:uncharacterized protein BJ171DRAFT_127146 [Polychytrium aggregatum]KAI9203992.1 hypothetical protein BJ171DRAFT_127146 [Polychytrium aggregatum]